MKLPIFDWVKKLLKFETVKIIKYDNMKNDALFSKAFDELIGIEGGYVNDPTDRGGETKYGISKRSYPNEDIRGLTLQRAKEIYYKDFWQKTGADRVYDDKISNELFDTGVNMGVGTATRFFQQALNLMNRNQRDFPDLVVDGILGVKTFRGYDKVDKSILLKVLNGLQFCRYKEICERDPSQEKYFNGWMKRI